MTDRRSPLGRRIDADRATPDWRQAFHDGAGPKPLKAAGKQPAWDELGRPLNRAARRLAKRPRGRK